MCGFAGIFRGIKSNARIDLENTMLRMCDRLVHRGPDDSGIWVDISSGVALGHRRLSIIDLSPAGHQPMVSPDGSLVIVFNGEIYNFLEIKSDLEKQGVAPSWRGYSDTEVLLAAISAWGVEIALQRCAGMFAFALWIRKEKALYLGRDRMGEKPLYYGWSGDDFLFASELKAFTGFPSWRGEIDKSSLEQYLRHGYIPAPLSIFKKVYKVQPGTYLRVGSRERISCSSTPLTPKEFWSVQDVLERGMKFPFSGTGDEAVEKLDDLLTAAVGRMMVSDVPLGAFLSGGIDSSTIVSLMQAQSIHPVKTFTIGFQEAEFQEAGYARAIANHLGTEHYEMTVTAEDALDVLPQMPILFDEPFADQSQIPTYLVSKLTRQHVTVSLSGDGGDELFGGYTRYFLAKKIWDRFGFLPCTARKLICDLIDTTPRKLLDFGFGWLGDSVNTNGRSHVSGKLRKLATILDAPTPHEFYCKMVSVWNNPPLIAFEDIPKPNPLNWKNKDNNSKEAFFHWMMLRDLLQYLPDDILVKVDRASMGVSLETRVPLLSQEVVEFALSLPLSLNVDRNEGKKVLKDLLYRYVPKELLDRPKMGFAMPISEWLRGPLRDWAESLLSEKRLLEDGLFNTVTIRNKWKEHLKGEADWSYMLWNIVIFQQWQNHWKSYLLSNCNNSKDSICSFG